jgi:hypothetical protein
MVSEGSLPLKCRVFQSRAAHIMATRKERGKEWKEGEGEGEYNCSS